MTGFCGPVVLLSCCLVVLLSCFFVVLLSCCPVVLLPNLSWLPCCPIVPACPVVRCSMAVPGMEPGGPPEFLKDPQQLLIEISPCPRSLPYHALPRTAWPSTTAATSSRQLSTLGKPPQLSRARLPSEALSSMHPFLGARPRARCSRHLWASTPPCSSACSSSADSRCPSCLKAEHDLNSVLCFLFYSAPRCSRYPSCEAPGHPGCRRGRRRGRWGRGCLGGWWHDSSAA